MSRRSMDGGCAHRLHADHTDQVIAEREALHRDFCRMLAQAPPHVRAARPELDRWHEAMRGPLYVPMDGPRCAEKKPVRTQDGRQAQVVLLRQPGLCTPSWDSSRWAGQG